MIHRDKTILELDYHHAHPMLTLWRLYRGQYAVLFWSSLLFVLKHSPVWLIPLLSADIVNVLVARGSLHRVWIDAGILFVVIVSNVPLNTWWYKMISRAVRNVEARLRRALVRRLQELSMGVHDDMHSGAMQAKVLRDVEAIQGLSVSLINNGLSSLTLIIAALVVTLMREPWITVLFVIALPVGAAMIYLFRGRLVSSNYAFRSEMERMSATVSETINMLPVTRAHAAEEVEVERVDERLEKIRHSGMRLDAVNAMFGACMYVTFQVGYLLCLGVTGYFYWVGMVEVGDMFLYPALFGQVLAAVQAMLGVFPMLVKGFESIRSLGDILECPDLERNQGKEPVESVEGRFDLENVTFEYAQGNGHAIRGLSFSIEAGKSVAVVGPSGSGKSTLMNLLIGFRRPTSGRILLDGVDMETLDLRTYRRYLSVVPQETILYSGSLRENITYGLSDASDEDVARAIETANLDEVIEQLPDGVETIIGERGCRLSGGQRQRVAIARAVIRDPSVVIFDEATSSLDVQSEKLVQDAIDRMMAGRTTFIVAHRLSTIRKVDHVMFLREGECIESGTYEALLAADGAFARMHALQH